MLDRNFRTPAMPLEPLSSSVTTAADRLVLGCAAMLGSVDRRRSERAIAAALDAGVRHFDVARSYGYGQAESLLGRCLGPRREGIRIIGKYGIPPAAGLRANLIRTLRGGIGGVRSWRWRRPVGVDDIASAFWSPGALRSGLETSLRELRSDWLDVLLLHTPPASILERDELVRELERLRTQGKVLLWGVSGGPADRPDAVPAVACVQFAHGVFDVPLATPALPQWRLVHHVFGGRHGWQRLAVALSTACVRLPAGLAEHLSADPGLVAEIGLQGALAGAHAQQAVVAMFTPAHLAANLAALSNPRLSPTELQQILRVLRHPQSEHGGLPEVMEAES